MTYSDKLLGTTIDAGQTNRQYSQYKIEHTGPTLEEVVTVTKETKQELEDGTTELVTEKVPLADSEQTLTDYFTGAIQTDTDATETYTDSSGASVQYDNRVRVEDATTRDEVVAELDAESVDYDSFEFALSDKEKHIIEREDPDGTNLEQVLNQKSELIDRELVTDETKEPIASTLLSLESQDPELAQALSNVFEVMTGETPAEFDERTSSE